MRQSQRGVILLMAVGLAVALMVGIAVWNASSPEHTATAGYTSPVASEPAASARAAATASPSAKRTATSAITAGAATPTAGARGDHGSQASPTSPAVEDNGEVSLAQSAGAANPSYRMEADPLAPPHAVMAAPQPTAPPTQGTVYRPTNVLPTTDDAPGAASGSDTDSDADFSAAAPAEATRPTDSASAPSAPSVPPASSGTAEPTASDPATSEQSPAEPPEPTPAEPPEPTPAADQTAGAQPGPATDAPEAGSDVTGDETVPETP